MKESQILRGAVKEGENCEIDSSVVFSADYVELAMFGPGSEFLKPFVKNTDLHYLMLFAAEVENKF